MNAEKNGDTWHGNTQKENERKCKVFPNDLACLCQMQSFYTSEGMSPNERSRAFFFWIDLCFDN